MEFCREGTAVVLECCQVHLAVILGVVFPASEVDPYQLVSQGAAGLVVFVSIFFPLLFVVAASPKFDDEGTTCIFVKGLAAELRASMAEMDGLGIAALNDHWRDAVELGHVLGAAEAIPLGPESH